MEKIFKEFEERQKLEDEAAYIVKKTLGLGVVTGVGLTIVVGNIDNYFDQTSNSDVIKVDFSKTEKADCAAGNCNIENLYQRFAEQVSKHISADGKKARIEVGDDGTHTLILQDAPNAAP